MKRFYTVVFVLVSLTACKSDTEEIQNDVVDSIQEEQVEQEPQVGDITTYETLYDEDVFENPKHADLLNELNVCDSVAVEGSRIALCSPRNFVIRPFRNDVPEEDAFMLQIKANTVLKGQVDPLPMRHLIVFEREKGELIKVNGFRGYLESTIEKENGIKDIIVRFYVPEEGGVFFNCLFEWKDGKYRYVSVEEIHGGGGNGKVKEEFKEEISKDVYQSLMTHAMLF